jgi:hypothetical protein
MLRLSFPVLGAVLMVIGWAMPAPSKSVDDALAKRLTGACDTLVVEATGDACDRNGSGAWTCGPIIGAATAVAGTKYKIVTTQCGTGCSTAPTYTTCGGGGGGT